MNKPHKHAEIIKQWADGAEIEFYTEGKWIKTETPSWRAGSLYRIKPKVKWKPKHTLITSYINTRHKVITVPQEVHTYDTIQQFVNEFENDWDNQDCQVYKSSKLKRYNLHQCNDPTLGTILMSISCAKKLCEMLNNGEVEL